MDEGKANTGGDSPSSQKLRRAYRLGLILSIAGIAVLGFLNRDYLQTGFINQLQELPLAVAVSLMLLITTVGIIALIPNSILFLATGALFGVTLGFLINLAGFVLGSTAAFLIARTVARDYIDQRAHKRIVFLTDYVSRAGWKAVAVLRVIPVMPAFLLNYLLGVTQIRLRDYVLTSGLFIIPSCFAITYTGATGRDLLAGEGISAQQILVLVGIIVGLVVLRRVMKREVKTP